jgi:hypothetical protein
MYKWEVCSGLFSKVISDTVPRFLATGSITASTRKLGVDVMITIFCDFPQFSAKKLAFFLNTNVMIKKTPIFLQKFSAKKF